MTTLPQPSQPCQVRFRLALRPDVTAAVGNLTLIPSAFPSLPLLSVMHVGHPKDGDQSVRLDCRAFYERVWSEPVETIAEAWGLSGRGLAKVCKRVRIAVPPRGYWAKAQHGRRPAWVPLWELQGGRVVEIVIHGPALAPGRSARSSATAQVLADCDFH